MALLRPFGNSTAEFKLQHILQDGVPLTMVNSYIYH